MRLWDFAVWAYARPGTQATCLELQDVHHQCVSLLLWRLWALEEGRVVDDLTLRSAASTARVWEHAVIVPLRRLRGDLKPPLSALHGRGLPALREQIKTCELTAERLLLEALEAATPATFGGPGMALQAMQTVVRVWGAAAPKPVLRGLIRATSR